MTADAPAPSVRALVLGGGGLAGIAWEVGVLVGLAEGGVDLGLADRIVGTSAGSVVGTLLSTGVDLEAVHAEHRSGAAAGNGGPPATLDMEALGAQLAAAMDGARDPGEMRARLGAWALAADTPPEAERRAIIDARLPVKEWPRTDLRITAVDAETGEFRAFDRDSGVPLVHAVAASCAVPGVYPPVTIDGRRYVDGGMRSAANADLAHGHDRLVVLAPIPRGFGPMASVDAQVTGMVSRVAVVSPDKDSRAAIGRNVLDPAARAPSAKAGRAQAASVAERIAEVWNG